MMNNKTDIEIAADAIKYCRKELEKYNHLLSKYDEYEKQKLEYVLGLSNERPMFPYAQEEVNFYAKNF